MPELPEVESIRRKLEPHLLGKRISAVEILLPRQIATPSPRIFTKKLLDKRIVALLRIGKYLFFQLEPSGFFHVHLRMTGHLEYGLQQPDYTRFVLQFAKTRN
ncbi:MAG: bifunctional DNA-formamidopyrimidine glycosylase/DNA-(apurinic or apyrimidinic site) lyase, partial [bacterium]|nr:bifunctional DNA-formamidopyrimidine glycosylase/DNA-(apurinic or apyrimidinic site) lyase [bacterium]